MSLLIYLIICGTILIIAYRWGGGILGRFFKLNDSLPTAAVERRDGQDFEPAKRSYLLPQHFSAIAAAGPIVGPILAGIYFGWLPTLLWIILGAIFIGGVHDFTTLIASVRNRGGSIAQIVKENVNRRSYILFLVFIWIALVYVIIAFTDVTASAFVQVSPTAGEEAPGPAVASSSAFYLLLAFLMGLTLKLTKLPSTMVRLIFIPLVFVTILLGPLIPLDLQKLFGFSRPQLVWDLILLFYCFTASIIPLWLLLQPRGYLGGYFLYIVMVGGVLGIIVGGLSGQLTIAAPAFASAPLLDYHTTLPPLFPVLFITVACGACSGFHCIVASGTTSKQLEKESDAKPVAYGAMLLEAFFACISLATVMILVKPAGKPDAIYAQGLGQFISQATFGLITPKIAVQFALLCFATFIFDTLDACTRLARYVLMELTGWKGKPGMVLATVTTLLFPLIVIFLPPAELDGKTIPLWRVFWNLFGSSNQLLAALALLGITTWVARLGKKIWITLLPMVFMTTMTLWSLIIIVLNYLQLPARSTLHPLKQIEFGVALGLTLLAFWLLVEAVIALFRLNFSLPFRKQATLA